MTLVYGCYPCCTFVATSVTLLLVPSSLEDLLFNSPPLPINLLAPATSYHLNVIPPLQHELQMCSQPLVTSMPSLPFHVDYKLTHSLLSPWCHPFPWHVHYFKHPTSPSPSFLCTFFCICTSKFLLVKFFKS